MTQSIEGKTIMTSAACQHSNSAQATVDGRFTTGDARIKLKRRYLTIIE